LKDWDHEHDENPIDYPQLAQIRLILERLCLIVDDIISKHLNSLDKEYLLGAARFTYDARLRPVLGYLEKHRVGKQKPCAQCGTVHTRLPEEIYGAYDKLNQLLPKG
jgi:hypothetical protein